MELEELNGTDSTEDVDDDTSLTPELVIMMNGGEVAGSLPGALQTKSWPMRKARMKLMRNIWPQVCKHFYSYSVPLLTLLYLNLSATITVSPSGAAEGNTVEANTTPRTNYITVDDSEDEEVKVEVEEVEMDGRDDDVVEIVVHMVD